MERDVADGDFSRGGDIGKSDGVNVFHWNHHRLSVFLVYGHHFNLCQSGENTAQDYERDNIFFHNNGVLGLFAEFENVIIAYHQHINA